ncbi:hypothetical protein [Pelomonas sp. SE-A7]|uniref:hypothetical protein n=1 Tax=Pelomonas sp. SE-A7 TaxID=3054953 RepID=UPI00259D28A6|nr:hypothetical protein [Pelomonas sp. SE-A7]MDM4768292.1 hypothetical protein [Pelomonas sp. SE-A7]
MGFILTQGQRRLALTAHVATSVSLLGAVASFLVLAVAGLQAHEPQLMRAAYVGMDLLARLAILPLALAALLTGALMAWGTPWGFFRHYWVIAKLLLTAFAMAVLLAKMPLAATAAALANEPVLRLGALHEAGAQLDFHSISGLLVLLVPTILSIYKPRGMTDHGRRTQGSADRPAVQTVNDNSRAEAEHPVVTIRLNRAQMIGIVGAIFVLHLVILHAIGVGHFGH